MAGGGSFSSSYLLQFNYCTMPNAPNEQVGLTDLFPNNSNQENGTNKLHYPELFKLRVSSMQSY